MATLANIFNNLTGARAIADAADACGVRAVADDSRLRPLPNEDVYFFAKRIDNSRVMRQADPQARSRDWKLVSGAGAAAACLVAVLLPSAYGLISGYQLSQLQQENQRLLAEKKRLEMEESQLTSMERLSHLAQMQKFVDPEPSRTHYLPRNDSSLAMTRR